VFLTPHFYGELAKTREGCDLIDKKKHVTKFLKIAKNSANKPIERRAALWVLGHITSSQTGFRFVEKLNVTNLIVDLAETSPSLSIRGTCFYILGMISRIDKGREMLNALGWESPGNLNSCISVPKDIRISGFFRLPDYKYEGSRALVASIEQVTEKDESIKEILSTVANLSNTISAESASRTLKRLRNQHPELFSSATVMTHVFRLLSMYKYRLQVRRFIYEMFEVQWTEEALTLLDRIVNAAVTGPLSPS